ncbi:ATP synthase subunit I [Brevibacillus migulae]|uniref:ATP synthase subunit I n=1 Tax=Brevibacillus migulae TaxID=1644114 RepID=UPI00106E5E25|nr:ATP synthase subunit I [Brevibacillus migulae]
METFSLAMRRTFRYTFIGIAITAILWALLPGYHLFLQSLLLGMVGSLLNGLILLSKTWRVGKMGEDPSVRPRGTGMTSRLATVAIVVFLTIRYPQLFTLSGVLIGLFLFQAVGSYFVYRSLK